MRKVIFMIIALSFMSSDTFYAQTDSDHPLASLAISRLNVRFTLSGSLVGLGSGANAAGRSVVWPYADASALSWNPAALGSLEKRSVIMDWVPGISQDLTNFSSLYDIEAKINTEMDSALSNYGTSGSSVAYPDLKPVAGFRSDIAGFGMAIPFSLNGKSMGIGFGFSTPLRLNLDIQGTGIEALIDSEQNIENTTRRIRMRVHANMVSSLDVAVNQFMVGFGAELADGFMMGLTASRYNINASARARANIDGIIEMSGNEYAFNDPNDANIDFAAGETNALSQSMQSDFSGSGWGCKIGLIKKISERLQIGLTIDLPPTLKSRGTYSSVMHEIPFIKLEEDSVSGDGGVADMIDPTAINLAQLTRTERKEENNSHRLNIEFPRAYNLGIVFGSGNFNMILRLTSYSGQFGYDLIGEEQRGLKFKYGGGLTLDFKYFFLGGSISMVDEIKPTVVEEAAVTDDPSDPLVNLPLANFNLGFRIPTALGVWVDGIIGVEPIPTLRLSFRYNF